MRLARPAGEVVLLFVALLCLLPYVPSNEMENLPFLPLGAVGIAAFFGSRALRWGRQWPMALVEGSGFAAFSLILHRTQEMLF